VRSNLLRRQRSERGETLIEFAFASVIFFVMIFGAIEFGLAVWEYNLVSDLAQEGARYAIVHGANSGSPKTEAQVASYVQSRAIGMNVTTTTPLGAPGTLPPWSVVEVSVSHTLSWGGGVLPIWNFPVSSRAQMIVTR
jgi:Flp pilus assembly protein TadG